MNFKKRLNGSWVDTSCYIHKTATDTFANLPATLYPTGVTSTVELKGNTVQSGTPTPDNPIYPSECGDRTGNLFDISTWHGVTATRGNVEEVENGFRITALSNDAYTNTYASSVPQCSYKVSQGETYTLSWEVDNPNIYGVVYVFSGGAVGNNALTNIASAQQKVSFTVPSGHNYIAFRLGVLSSGNSITYTNIMLNTGSTHLPYEPYGIEIPISSANTTTPVYLGEVESTRRIKKLVLTGDEDSWHISGNFFYNDNINPDYLRTSYRTVYCTHYQGINNVTAGSQVGDGECAFYSVVGVQRLYIKDSNYSTVASFTTYLQQQYAAGTPVTVWYVLAEPETGIVNEPIRKIGDYADEVSGITIPTIAGANTLSVDTTVQPSGVAINYKGWHNAKCKEYNYNMTIADWESASISQMENHTIQELQGGNWV